MNQPVTRRRRRTASPTSDLSVIDVLSNSTNDNPDTSRKRQRRVANSDDLNIVPESPQPRQPSEQITDEISPIQPSPSSNIERVDRVNPIRSEILDDDYHSQLAESNYFDDTHNWSNDSSQSDDYWHFLGLYD